MLRISDEPPNTAWTPPCGDVVDLGGVKAYQVELQFHGKPGPETLDRKRDRSPEGRDAVIAATSKRGLISLVVTALPERGVDTIHAPSVSTKDVLHAKMVVQAVLRRYFTPHN